MSGVEGVESAIAIFYNATPVEYSTQQIVSCSSKYGNGGCSGGQAYIGWNYMMDNALVSAANYPYTSGSGVTGTCKVNESEGIVKTSNSFPTLPFNDVLNTNQAMMDAITQQPVSSMIDSSSTLFQFYSSGIISSDTCGTFINTWIVIVGYGSDSGLDYFLVRNAWGSNWGDNGFVKIAQSSTGGYPGYCGINSDPMYPNAEYAN